MKNNNYFFNFLSVMTFIVLLFFLIPDFLSTKSEIKELKKEIQSIRNKQCDTLNNKDLVDLSKYINFRIDQLDMHLKDLYNFVDANRQMIDKNYVDKFDWIDGKTTNEIDSLMSLGNYYVPKSVRNN